MKKIVRSSHLSLRFYKNDGWTLECLQKYLIHGEIKDTEVTHGDPASSAYFQITVGSRLDIKKLYSEEIETVQRWYRGEPEESDVEFMEEMNW